MLKGGINLILEIASEEEFRSIKHNGIGYVVITDGNKSKLHVVNCPDVDFYYFKTKVIDNNNKNGRYYFSDSLIEIKNRLNSEDCLHCKHLY